MVERLETTNKMKEARIQLFINQIRKRWKNSKASCYKAKSQNGKSGSACFHFYTLMDDDLAL